jgi:hypothetical protein
MATALDWIPDPFQPQAAVHAESVHAKSVHAESSGTTYRVTGWPPGSTGDGAYTALAGDHALGRFPYTEAGRRAALTACESHAAFVGDSLRAQAEITERNDASAQSA